MATELTEELKEQQENLGGNIIDNDLDTDNLVLDEDSISSATDEYNTELEEDVETGENIPTDSPEGQPINAETLFCFGQAAQAMPSHYFCVSYSFIRILAISSAIVFQACIFHASANSIFFHSL